MLSKIDRWAWIWLVAGILLTVGAEMRWGIGALAWIAPVPFLRYLRVTRGWKSQLLFMVAMLIAWTLVVFKIITEPVPLAFAPGFGLVLALFLGVPYLGWNVLRRMGGDGLLTVLGFAGLMSIAEWLQHVATPFGSWGAAAYTQVEHLALLQLASLVGMAGVSFLVYIVASALELALAQGPARARTPLAVAGAAVALALTFGGLRLAASGVAHDETALVAAVGTDLDVSPGGALPTDEELRAVEDAIVRRTRNAAAAGAQLVSWTEAAMLVMPEKEAAFLDRHAALADDLDIELVAGYVVLLSEQPFQYENKYAWFRPDGSLDHQYLKHHPVAGEPAVKGTGPLGAVDSKLGSLSGAICYDYDYPRLGLQHARQDADMVIVPSSDWRGIDPIHTQMAAIRAIEGGHSVLRSTRWGLSAGIDRHGRIRGWRSDFDDDRKVLLVDMPLEGVATVYGTIGDAFIGGLFLLVGMAYLVAVRQAAMRPRPCRRARRAAVPTA
jgi:apolipoprotein N-acyltransferase